MECIACHSTLIEGAGFCPKCGSRQPGAPEYDSFEFSAFISYRHRSPDAMVAKKVARAIETYRLPKAIARSYGDNKLGRTFLDQDELPATSSLPTAIRDAIKRSSSLIVVCSPDTPASKWVENEIEMFASFHGRDRIFAVLVEGATSECLPEALKTRAVPDADGVFRQMPAEPLAADMRPSAKGSFDREKLRIIAAIAGCSFDDLRNRERSRRRKRVAIAVIALAIIAAAIVGLGFQWTQQRANAQIEESRRLAAESQELFRQGDRFGAIDAALSALPSSAASPDRPLVAEAQLALEQALEVYPSPTPRQSAFAIDPALSADCYAIGSTSDDDAWLAVKDDSAVVRVFGLDDGLQKEQCALPLANGADRHASIGEELFAAEGTVILASSSTEKPVYGIDAETGAIAWKWGDAAPIAAALSQDGRLLGVLHKGGDSELALSVLNAKTGREQQNIDLTRRQSAIDQQGTPSVRLCFCGSGDAVYAAMPGKIARIVLEDDEVKAVDADTLPQIQSIDCADGKIVVCSFAQAAPQRVQTRIDVFDEKLKKLWDRQFAQPTVHMENGNATACQPRFWYSDKVEDLGGESVEGKADAQALVISTDTYIAIFAADDGEPLGTIPGDSPAICVQDDGFNMVAVWADGRITENSFPLSSNFRESDSLVTETQGPLVSAEIGSGAVVMEPADVKRGLFCFTRYWSNQLPNLGRIQRASRGYLGKVNEISRTLPGFCQSADSSKFAFMTGLHNKCLAYVNSNDVSEGFANWTLLDLEELTGVDFETARVAIKFSATDSNLVYVFTVDESKAPRLWAVDLASQALAGHYDMNDFPGSASALPALALMLVKACIDSASDEALCLPNSTYGATVFDPRTLEAVSDYAMSESPGTVVHAAKGEDVLVLEKALPDPSDASGLTISPEARIVVVDSASGKPMDCQADDYSVALNETGLSSGFVISPDGKQLLIACSDGSLRCFSLPDGQLIWERDFDFASTQCIRFLQDNETRIIVRDKNDVATIIDANSGQEICSASTEPGIVLSCRMSADGTRIHLITQTNQYAPSVLQTFAFDGESLNMVTKVYYAYALSQDESRIVACDGWGEFNIPRYTLDELISLGRSLLDSRG